MCNYPLTKSSGLFLKLLCNDENNLNKRINLLKNIILFQEKLDTGSQSLNVLRVQKYLDKSRMKELARDNMPFMGLDIHGLKEIELSQVNIKLLVLMFKYSVHGTRRN